MRIAARIPSVVAWSSLLLGVAIYTDRLIRTRWDDQMQFTAWSPGSGVVYEKYIDVSLCAGEIALTGVS